MHAPQNARAAEMKEQSQAISDAQSRQQKAVFLLTGVIAVSIEICVHCAMGGQSVQDWWVDDVRICRMLEEAHESCIVGLANENPAAAGLAARLRVNQTGSSSW